MSETEGQKSAAAAKADEVKAAVGRLDLRHKMIYLASAALVVLFLLPWWSMSVKVPLLGVNESHSTNGLHDLGVIGFLAACLATAVGLANMGLIPVGGELKRLAGLTMVQLVLTSVAVLAGPVYFWTQVSDAPSMSMGATTAGKTLFFWLALLAGLAAAGGAGWKYADERKSAAPPS